MSSNKLRRKTTLWNVAIERGSPVAPALASFSRSKKILLKYLCNEYSRGPKSRPFDATNSWRDLIRLANFYFWETQLAEAPTTAVNRAARLRKLAKALQEAHGIADKAMQDDVGNDLFRGWCTEANINAADPQVFFDDGSSKLTRIVDEIKKVVDGIATLEAAARRAAHNVPKSRRGRSKGSVLPLEYIYGLARVYRESTGLKPDKAINGPFARLVHEFLTATGPHGNISKDYVAETSMRVLRRTPVPGGFNPSPFI